MFQGCSPLQIMPRAFPKNLFMSAVMAGVSCLHLFFAESVLPLFCDLPGLDVDTAVQLREGYETLKQSP